MWRGLREAREDERGAVTLFAVVVLGILLVGSAFVVDLGLQRVARSDMQAVADLVALDLARELDGRSVSELEPVMDAALVRSLARNADTVGEDAELDYALGRMQDGGFQELGGGTPSAVRVMASTEVAFAFAGVTGKESGAAARSAVAESSSTTCFRLGSFVAAVRAEDSTVLAPLNDLLGVELDLVSYKGLAVADLRLAQLAATSVFGSPEELLSGQVRYADVVEATIEALTEEPGDNTVAVQALTRILASTTTVDVGDIALADVLHVAPTDVAALGVELDVLDLVASARLADGQYFLGVPNIQGQVPGVGFQFTGALYLVSAAELACGAPNSAQAVADTAQLDGTVGITFTNLPSLNIAGLGTVQTAKGTGSLQVTAGSGTGQVVTPPAVHCGNNTAADPSTFRVDVTTGLASYRLETNVTVGGDVQVKALQDLGLGPLLNNLLGLLGLNTKVAIEVDVLLRIGTSSGGGTGHADLSIPPNDETPISTGSSMYLDPATIVPTILGVKIGGKAANLSAVTTLTSLITGALVTSGKGFFEKSLTPLVANINQEFIGPVARMVGLRLAGADVYGVHATCARPRLSG